MGAEQPLRFVVLSARRAGSNMLCTILDAHPAVRCHHELFNPRGIFVALELRGQEHCFGDLSTRDRDPLGFLRQVWAASAQHAAVGFKMTREQQPEVLQAVLDDPGVRKIVLRRADLVRGFVSERIAERLDQWEVYDAAVLASPRPRVRIGVEELRRHVDEVEAYYRRITTALQRSGQAWLELHYEALSTLAEQARAFEHLGVAPPFQAIAARSVRQNPQPLHELVANHAELLAALHGDPLARSLQ
jgi:LPS sulfotransferase NodH